MAQCSKMEPELGAKLAIVLSFNSYRKASTEFDSRDAQGVMEVYNIQCRDLCFPNCANIMRLPKKATDTR